MVDAVVQISNVERVTRACAAHDDALSLRLAVLDEIRRVVDFDAYAWLLTDPATEVGAAPLADVPCRSDLPRLIVLKYLTTVNRWTLLDTPVGLLRAATSGEPGRSLVWRDMLADYGIGDVASMVFRDRFGTWAFLDLWREGHNASFTQDQAEFLTAIAGPVTEALRRSQARTFEITGADLVRTGPAVLTLSPELEMKAQTPETESYLRTLVPPDSAGDPPVPAGAYNVAAQLLAVECGVDSHPPSARVHLTGGTWLTLRAARLAGAGPADHQDIAVSIETTSPTERTALFARAAGLSDREGELVAHLATGADTREIARRMFLSENTIQDHFKSIFAKTGARNRRALLARAVGR